jgi:GntR family transcriptional regulator
MNAPTFQPLYYQIKALLTTSLQRGEWKPGEAIPSEIELAARFQVSQGTVRKAVEELAAENLLVRRQGKGTFVATHTEEHTSTFRFLRLRSTEGGAQVIPASVLLDVRRGKANAEVARLLQIKSGEALVVVRRVLEFAGEPVVHEEIALPAPLFKGLSKAKLDAYHGSMYAFFESQYGVRMIRAVEHLSAIGADAATAELLGVKPGAPLLAVDRVAFTYGDRPVEWRRGLCSTRNYFYLNELS